jgi:hypothetical protein
VSFSFRVCVWLLSKRHDPHRFRQRPAGQLPIQRTLKRSPSFLSALTILPIDTNGYIPLQSDALPIMTKRGRRRIPQSRLVST